MNIFNMITSLATAVTAIIAMIMMLNNWKPILMKSKKICNAGKDPIYLTKIYTSVGTFPSIVRDAENRGHFLDSGLQELPLNKLLYHGEDFTIPTQFLYIEGQECQFEIRTRRDFSRGLSFHNYKIEALPHLSV